MIVFTVEDDDQLLCCVLREGRWLGAFSDTYDALLLDDILVEGMQDRFTELDSVRLSCWRK
jgi:hypothetical protein